MKGTLGLLPPLGGGLTTSAAAGQAERLIDNYFRAYAAHFEGIYYFSRR